MSETLTIAELAERASRVLRDGAPGANGRVREVPSERLIRWYTTIGLVDPPLTRRGRVARYGRRHLLQVVAVKRLQADGLSIADIQVRLTGATDAALEEVARLPAAPGPSTANAETPETPETPETRPPERFWARSPAARRAEQPSAQGPAQSPAQGPAQGTAQSPAQGPAQGTAQSPAQSAAQSPAQGPAQGAEPPVRPSATPVHGVRLAPGVTLLLDGAARGLAPGDLAAVSTAAAPLLAALRDLGLAPAGVPPYNPYTAHTTPPDMPEEPDETPSEGSTR
ncbi:MerR HTH family regulatory protein [Sinosporangium album]|uniref:MerR HTH family regulatory protein n=1 Tax=Sinosporangium album TaxID=504805 RepID=A0A1G7XKA3_9ACTN|nr:helix-turn-helix domain-containing protein [Sinosporangium album]SDG84642.1 MerR HTH family regulatory protein [Sinosporangium album]